MSFHDARGNLCLQIEVRDQGTGILPEDLPWVTRHSCRSELSRSSGLGLSTVQTPSVERNEGRLEFESELGQPPPGGGKERVDWVVDRFGSDPYNLAMAKQSRLSQVIAVEKQVKSRVNSEGAELHKNNQKPDLFNGMNRTYERKDEDGEDLPPEQKLVQHRAQENLTQWSRLWTELLDVVATKDWGNLTARADLVIEGETLVKDAPVTYLIWLEKQLEDLRTFVANLPVLDPGKAWKWDPASSLSVTEPIRTARHKKVPRVLLKVEASEHHPGQAEIVHDDILVGYWSNVSLSGALPDSRRRRLLDRIDGLRKAVKEAREEANSIRVDQVAVGTVLCNWLLKD